MAGGVSNGKGGVKADINVTPLVDVVFVLLIIFMVVTPMLASGKDVVLPKARSSTVEPATSRDPVVLTVTADRQLWLERTPLSLGDVERHVRARLKQSPGAALLVKADAAVSMADVRPLMKRLQAARVHQVAFVVEEGATLP